MNNNVFNISSACDKDIFNILPNSKEKKNIDFTSFSPFILYSGASDPRKNVQGLLKAYSLLPSKLKEYNLVFHTTFLLLVVTNIIAWGYLFYQFIPQLWGPLLK